MRKTHLYPLIVAVCMNFVLVATAQTSFEGEKWAQAEDLLNTGLFQQAAQEFAALSKESEQKQDWEAWIYASNRVARSYGEIHRLDAEPWIQQVLEKGPERLSPQHPELYYAHFSSGYAQLCQG